MRFSRRLTKVAPLGTSHTTDPNDPALGHGADIAPVSQHEKYLVLSEDERAKGFVRPVRTSYMHIGRPGPRFALQELTAEQRERYGDKYVKYEQYPEGEDAIGRYWTQQQLDTVDKGCGAITTMGLAIAETYAANPSFYGSTYCCSCRMHKPVGQDGEFVWVVDGMPTEIRVGT